MTRRTSWIVGMAMVLTLGLSTAASAQSVYVGGGLNVPTGDLKDVADVGSGWMGVLGVLFPFGEDSPASFGVEGGYGKTGKSKLSGAEDVNASLYTVLGMLEFSFLPDGTVHPFVYGGAGIAGSSLSEEVSALELEKTKSGFGYAFGAGLGFDLSESVGIWVDGRYVGSSDVKFWAILAGFGFDL
ncbi:MAG: porin family protein [Gemmatimonadota bacterium]|nr:porin family protein [Gemmatimonadota bacterium]